MQMPDISLKLLSNKVLFIKKIPLPLTRASFQEKNTIVCGLHENDKLFN
jgi:hypothetical protein